MWARRLTIQDLDVHGYLIPQRRIQEENRRYGMAFNSGELKVKSIKKLRDYLEKHPNAQYLDEVVKNDVNTPENIADNTEQNTIIQIIPKVEQCVIQIDNDKPIRYEFPQGKTKDDLIVYLYKFFNQ